MKPCSISVLLCLALILPSQAGNAGEAEHKLITFSGWMKDAVKQDANWKTCGDYFAAAESSDGKIVHFAFEGGTSEHSARRTFTFATIDRLIISLEEKATVPVVTVLWSGRNTRFAIKLNAKDYTAGLPCIATKSTGV